MPTAATPPGNSADCTTHRADRQNLFQASFGNGDAGEFGDGLHGRQERVLRGGLDQPALEFISERALR